MQGISLFFLQDRGSSEHGGLHLILLVSTSPPCEGPFATDVEDHEAALKPRLEPDVGGHAQPTGAFCCLLDAFCFISAGACLAERRG